MAIAGVWVFGPATDAVGAPPLSATDAGPLATLDSCTDQGGTWLAQGRITDPDTASAEHRLEVFFAGADGVVVGREWVVAPAGATAWELSYATDVAPIRCLIGSVTVTEVAEEGGTVEVWRFVAFGASALVLVTAGGFAIRELVRLRRRGESADLPVAGELETGAEVLVAGTPETGAGVPVAGELESAGDVPVAEIEGLSAGTGDGPEPDGGEAVGSAEAVADEVAEPATDVEAVEPVEVAEAEVSDGAPELGGAPELDEAPEPGQAAELDEVSGTDEQVPGIDERDELPAELDELSDADPVVGEQVDGTAELAGPAVEPEEVPAGMAEPDEVSGGTELDELDEADDMFDPFPMPEPEPIEAPAEVTASVAATEQAAEPEPDDAVQTVPAAQPDEDEDTDWLADLLGGDATDDADTDEDGDDWLDALFGDDSDEDEPSAPGDDEGLDWLDDLLAPDQGGRSTT
ncbi:hypothetical protein Cde04nite_01670 [Cellulomonas denverensis]|nr:hypothetical protein [Cellulomonas denverensis]GIG23923.1 hypothetical protein Cde04nite_01670 [Cellulomonas denverensis]